MPKVSTAVLPVFSLPHIRGAVGYSAVNSLYIPWLRNQTSVQSDWPILWGHSGPLCHALSLLSIICRRLRIDVHDNDNDNNDNA